MSTPAQMLDAIETDLEGAALLTDPLLNKGTAFSEEERSEFGLHGLLPPIVGSLEDQMGRRLQALHRLDSPLDRHFFLRGLQDANETLFYALLTRNLTELLPLVYTPTVGQACQEFSHYWHYPRGVFLSWPQRERIDEILAHPRYDRIQTIVVSDGERILGLGDQGAGGMGIPIGKLSLYTACAGMHPTTTLPILLDTGTDNAELIADPSYIGWKHPRLRGAEYDEFIESFVSAVDRRWPHVLLQWEDFARANAGRLLERYRDRLCTFNDDIQGTAAAAAGTLLAAARVTGLPLHRQTIVLFGAGTAGCGIGNLLLRMMIEEGATPAEAHRRFFAVDRDGLLVDGMPGIQDFQRPFVQAREAVAGWKLADAPRIGLHDVVINARPGVLIGVSGQPGVFTEAIVRSMAAAAERPVIFPLSNPVSRAEATPADLLAWTAGLALVGTGSPFPPVEIAGRPCSFDQTNNAYVFPGVGLGVLAVRARRVSDGLFAAAARALAALSPAAAGTGASLLPAVSELRAVAVAVATAVALQARSEGLCEPFPDQALDAMIQRRMWQPAYRAYRRRTPNRGLQIL
jgi:malate dehydrogenase (oxaloacetate-decarboxylating)